MFVEGDKAFSVPASSFGISASSSGYTLNYSCDGKSWTAWEESTPANEQVFVTGAPQMMKYKLVGNTGEVEIRW